jgi:hypothetical protein
VARRVELLDGQNFSSADMVLPRTAAIEGQVVDEFGDPAPGMTVQAGRVQFVAGKHRLMPVPGALSRPTDDRGQFRIFNLPPDVYYLVALSGPFAGPDEAAGFALTYFPGTAAPADAEPVEVGVGQDVTGVIVPLTPAETWTVSGVATDEHGKPSQTDIMLLPTTGGDVRSMVMSRFQSDPNGAFVIRNVAAGTYVLHGFGRPVGGGNLGRAPFGATEIAVQSDMRDVTIRVAPGTSLRGRILLEGGAPPPAPGRVRVIPTPVNFVSGPAGGGPPESVTHDDWTFETKNMVGSRVVNATAGAAGWMLKSVTRDGKDITDQPVDFSAGDVDHVDITLTSVVSAVTGTVTDAGQPFPQCLVLVFADDARKWAYPSRYLSVGRPNAQGRFTVSGLPPADYLVIAVAVMPGQDWQNPEVLERYRAQATRVGLGEGASVQVELRFNR